MLVTLGVGLAVAVGATMQRISGMSVGLIAAPVLSLLLVLVGALLLLALSIVTLGKRYVPDVEGVVPAAISGVIGGFMNTLAGVAGPAITVYAHAARWPQRVYAATLQPIFLVAGALSFTVMELTGAADVSAIEPALWATTLVALAVGIVVGKLLAPRVPSDIARKIALALAFLGARRRSCAGCCSAAGLRTRGVC